MFEEKTASRPHAMALAVVLALGLTGCGGSSNVKPTTPPPSDTGNNEPQPAIDAHLVLVHAEQAHDAGYTGKGVVIGIVDSGINRQHPALSGRVVNSQNFLDCNINNCNKDDVVGHGTMVSLIAAGKSFDEWPGGIAPKAELVSERIIQDEEPTDDGSGRGNEIEASDAGFFADYLNPYMIQSGVQVMNNSWGGLYFNPDHPATVAAAFADAYRPFVIDHDGIVVFAAGNSSFANPSDLASLPYWDKDLERGWIVAVALDTLHPTKLADYSNRCGRSMDYCLAAPGSVAVPGPYKGFNDDAGWNIYIIDGTSFAAPAVSGAAAVVWEAFPYFNNDMVRQTLLSTAKDLGDPGVDKVFGWGLLDVGKAVKGPAQFAWGDVDVSFDDITSTWSNDISGSGGLVKDGTGTLVLAGNDTYTGGTTVAGGMLQSANVLPGHVAVNAGAMLDGVSAGFPGAAGDLSNAGTLAVHGGDTTVGGNYTQSSTGTLAVSLGSKLDVTGAATLNGGTLEVTGADEGYVADTHTDVLTAAGGVSGTFDQLVKDAGVVFTSTTINYDGNNVWLDTRGLDITTAAAGGAVGYTAASMGSARRVQGAFEQLNSKISHGALGGVPGAFVQKAGEFQQSPNLRAAQASLESLSGQLHASSAAMTLQAIGATGRALSDRLDELSMLSSQPEGQRQSVWMSNLSLGGSLARSGYANVSYQLDGWLVGKDIPLNQHALAGFAFSQGHGTESLNQRFDRNQGRNTAGMFYAGWSGQRWYAHGRVGVGYYHQSINRMLLLGTSYQGVWTDYNGHYNVAYGESGLHFDIGQALLTPFVDLQYARVTRNGFAEQGAGGFGLKADDHTLQRWQSGIGMKLSRQWQFAGGRSISLDARAQWKHTLSESGAVFDASFVGLDEWRPLTGVGLSRRSTVFGLDLNARPSTNTRFKLGYEYLTGDRGRASVASASFDLSF